MADEDLIKAGQLANAKIAQCQDFHKESSIVGRGNCDAAFAADWDALACQLTPEELARLREFREALRNSDEHLACRKKALTSDPILLLRVLRSYAGDVKEATQNHGTYLDWRLKIQLDERVEQWRAELEEGRSRRVVLIQDYFAVTEMCPDKFGVPVLLFRWGVMDMAGILREVGREAVQLHWLHLCERASDQISSASRRTGTVIAGQVHVYDFGDYPQVPDWSSRMWQGVMQMSDVMRDINYPNVMRKLFLIRSAWTIRSLYRMSYPILLSVANPSTLALVHVYGQSASEWIAELREELEPEQELQEFLVCDSEFAFAAAEPSGGIVPEGAALAFDASGEDVTDWDGDADVTDGDDQVFGTFESQPSSRQQSILVLKPDNTFWHAHMIVPRVDVVDKRICSGLCARCRPLPQAHFWEQLEVLGTYERSPGGQLVLTCEHFRMTSGCPGMDPQQMDAQQLQQHLLWPLRVQREALDELVSNRQLRLHYKVSRVATGGIPGVVCAEELVRLREEIDAKAAVDDHTAGVILLCLGFPRHCRRGGHAHRQVDDQVEEMESVQEDFVDHESDAFLSCMSDDEPCLGRVQ